MVDYSLWKVIKNGNKPSVRIVVKGVETTIAPSTAEEKARKRLELKAIITLLTNIPNEHQLKFNSIKDARSCCRIVKSQVNEEQQQFLQRNHITKSSKKAQAEITQENGSKRAGDELEQKSSKKQKIDDGTDDAELKQLVNIILKEDIAIDAIPLAVKTPTVDWMIYKEGKKRPEKGYEGVLWGDLKVMFDPHVEDEVWKLQQRELFGESKNSQCVTNYFSNTLIDFSNGFMDSMTIPKDRPTDDNQGVIRRLRLGIAFHDLARTGGIYPGTLH
uniref:Uncharacterized protein n=1 Tax=Tanacetum cinerariifolium TaxID=118510 RepID=A0A699IAJ1_TANCI|nr:hypothetical protein [Tanacetum cinerariifolium]